MTEQKKSSGGDGDLIESLSATIIRIVYSSRLGHSITYDRYEVTVGILRLRLGHIESPEKEIALFSEHQHDAMHT